MGISYEEALNAQKSIEDKLLLDPNIVSIGVVEEINRQGQKSGNYIIKVGVISSEIYQNALAHGESIIPNEFTFISENGNQEIKHVQIKVVKTGQINALYSSNTAGDEHIPSAIDDIPPTYSQSSDDYTSRERPSMCGQSIGHSSITAGTLGLVVEYAEGPNIGNAYILSNNHVLAANNAGYVGDPITQPGKHDNGVIGRDTIAALHRWVPLDPTAINFVDAALALVNGNKKWSMYVSPEINKIGTPSDLGDAAIGMNVEKTGRTTGYTQGEVISINQTVKVNYGKAGFITFKDQISTTSMSKGGDSGACLVERGSKKPVGILFAGHESESFHNPIKAVFSSLSMSWINRYPSGKLHIFAKDHSLRIARRHYSSLPTSSFYQLPKSSSIIHNMLSNPLSRRRSIFLAFGIFSLKSTVDFTKSKTLHSDIPTINKKL